MHSRVSLRPSFWFDIHGVPRNHTGLGDIHVGDVIQCAVFFFFYMLYPRDGLQPYRGAGVTLGVELQSTAEVYPPAVSPKLKRSSTFPVSRMPS
ncbi:unnamed protein product [Strongylus vulgaris]|uniref:Uncharacterized protein n=1 Tax=Strongylus vulgaris TaxID=40348 RepID=A0A3P7L9Z2_STRVU|nr:unnamed protein product [Strongylus vulgaris]